MIHEDPLPSAPFKTALVQVEPAHLDKESNILKMIAFIREAASAGARLVVFPELVVTGYVPPYDPQEKRLFYDASEPVPGPTTERIGAVCKDLGIYTAFGTVERGQSVIGPVMHNVSVMMGPKGLVGLHRKVHLPGGEKLYFRPGNRFEVFETDLGRVSLLVCYDFWFPESSRIAGLQGAEIIIDSANWPAFDTSTWFSIGPGVAASNVLWLVQVNRVGGESYWPGFGGSQIVRPTGRVEVKAPDTEGITYGNIDVSRVSRQRMVTPVWFDRRPGLYGKIAEETE